MELQGSLTRLRPLGVEDAERTLSWRLGARARHMQRGARTVEEQRRWIAGRPASGELNFIIEYRGEPVGMIALLDINTVHRSVQMGRLLIGEEDLVGKAPVAFEADLLLCDHAFDALGMHKIYGDVMQENVGMLKTRLFLGYRQDGILRDHYLYDGGFKNTVAVSLLEDEYRSVCRPRLLQLIRTMSAFA